MVTTPELIDTLSASATPVRRLPAPFLGATLWLLLAGLVLLLLAAVHGARPDLALRLRDPSFAAALAGSLSTGILAAIAAFYLSLPDRSRLWLLLPAPALALWVATIGYGCLTDWVSMAPDGLRLGRTLECFTTLVIASLPLSLTLFVMLRHTARLHPTMVGMMGGLAAAGIAATALSLVHEIDATVMILAWNLGAAVLIVGLGGAFGRRIFGWTSPQPLDVLEEYR
jgi:hypothetical protein